MADLLPTFLVIGAMKAGTTTLCRDLEASPDVFFPTVKEPHTLCLDEVLTPGGRRRYAALFRTARPDQLRGEGSTGYTKRPGIDGVAERAKAVLGDDLRLVYIVRHPVDRIVSHHRHLVRGGDATPDINEAVRSMPELIDVSRYAMQLEPWIDTFGRAQLHVVRFEDYVADRRREVERVCAFLGATPPPSDADLGRVHNAGEEALVPPPGLRGLARRVTRGQFYKRVIHPRTPRWLRERLKATVYTRPESVASALTAETRAYLTDQFAGDLDRLARMLGRDDLRWDLSPHPVAESMQEG